MTQTPDTQETIQSILERRSCRYFLPDELPEEHLDLLLDIPLEIKVELGRCRIPIHELLNLNTGSAVKLLKLEGDTVDI